MKKTLQDQYLLIKEGKGHKGVFLADAKRDFPHIVPNHATFEEAAASLKTKNIISENVVGLSAIAGYEPKKKETYETAFEAFLAEARKAKENEDEKVKAEEKKVSKPVEKDLEKNFDYSDNKNPDNLIFDQIMMGYYAEMKDPKNADKTMQQLKDIVLKNLSKDPIHYTKDGQFGVKDLGYETEVPGLGTPKEAKGKYKSSGYGDLNEGVMYGDSDGDYDADNEEDEYTKTTKELRDAFKMRLSTKSKENDSPEESKLREVLREIISEELDEILKINLVKGGGGRRNVPSDVILTNDIIKKFDFSNPGPNTPTYDESIRIPHIKLTTSKETGKTSLLISDFLDIALKGITRGRTTRETEVAKNVLQKRQGDITDKDWSMIRALIKKYAETKPIPYPIGGGKTALYHEVTFPDTPKSLGDKFETGFSLDKIDNGLKINLPKKKEEKKEDTMESLRESVEKDLADINKEAEHEILQSKLDKIDVLIDKRKSQLGKLDEDEDMKALTDKKKVKELEKDIKKLEQAKSKVEKMLSKTKDKKKEVIDETENDMVDENMPLDDDMMGEEMSYDENY